MKIWEVILYAVLFGLTELTNISFSGHATVWAQTFRLTPLSEGVGLYIRAALCLGAAAAIFLNFRSDATACLRELRRRRGRSRRRQGTVQRREMLLLLFAAVPMLVSLFFTKSAEQFTWLLFVALFLVLNGGMLFLALRQPEGGKNKKTATLADLFLMGAARMVGVLPGLSPLALSWSVGRLCGLSDAYNLRTSYLLALEGAVIGFFYYLLRGILSAWFSAALLLYMLLAALLAALVGYFAVQYVQYLFGKKKQSVFVYYCWEAAVVVLILALINQ